MNNQINDLLKQLKIEREATEFYRTEMTSILDNAMASHNYGIARDAHDKAKQASAELDKQIRELVVEEFKATGEKRVHEKAYVKISRVFKVLDPARVLAWVKSNLADAMVVDQKKVEQYALKIGPVDGTEVIEEPKCQIATEL